MTTQNTKNSGNVALGVIIVIILTVLITLFVMIDYSSNTPTQTQETPSQSQITVEPRLLGKWFGKRSIYLGGGPKYLATFDPPLPEKSLFLPPTSSDPIYPYLVGLINEVWGLSLSDLSNPRIVSPFIIYDNLSGGGIFYFLPIKDESTKAVYGVGFEKR